MKPLRSIALPTVSAGMMKVFAAYTRRYVRRRFHSLRVLKTSLTRKCDRPLVIYLNHAAWWDPLVCLLLSREFFPGRPSYAPIEAAMLERYGIFKKLGFFGIEPRSRRGALTFLRTAQALLASPKNALWVTPQGRFADVRERPPRLEDGLGALAMRAPGAAFIPLAIEYAFWTESRPEILVSFGAPVVPGDEPPRSTEEWTGVFSAALESTQDALAAASRRRAADEWWVLNRGKSGIGGIYDAWRRLRARLSGERFTPGHSGEALR